jgi:hypothetical protein
MPSLFAHTCVETSIKNSEVYMQLPAKHIIYSFLSLILILFTFTSCSDNSTGVDDELMDPPLIPEAIPVEVEIDYFSSFPEFSEATEAYYEAAGYAQVASFTLIGGTVIGTGFLELAQSEEARFSNGVWEWDYTFQQGGESLTVRVTAEEVSGGHRWNVYLSGNFSDLGQNLDEFLFLTGIVNNDGTSGGWNYFSPDSENPFMSYNWNITSATEYEAEYTFSDPEDESVFTIRYERDGEENFIFLTGDEFESGIDVYWNTTTLTGYIVEDGVKNLLGFKL